MKKYAVLDYSHLLGMPGFSETLLKNHFTLYQGYVTNTNKVMETLEAMLKEGKQADYEAAELRRRLGWEWNGMRLHELYFENLGGDGDPTKAPTVMKAFEAQFGSFDAWAKEFNAAATMRGIGWVVLYQDIAQGLLINQWINEHDVGHCAGLNPILVLDCFEHAFMIDYGLKRADYIAAFMKNIKWEEVEKRYVKK
ncbi:MAG: Fe-Mn family superoxide dismutase [Desulfobaccales bacterium]